MAARGQAGRREPRALPATEDDSLPKRTTEPNAVAAPSYGAPLASGAMTSGVGPVSYIRVYTDAENVTRFEDLDYAVTPVEFAPPAPPVHVSEPMDATTVLFLSFPTGWTSPGHPSPARQFCFYLSGEAIVTAGLEERRLGAGTVLLLEDTVGPGHGVVVLADLVCAIVRL